MKKSILILVSILLLFSLLLPSCKSTPHENGILIVQRERESRTLSPSGVSLDVTKYHFVLTNNETQILNCDFVRDKNDSGEYVFSPIKAGTYTLTVYGLNSDDDILTTSGEKSCVILYGQENVLTFCEEKYHGNGTINLTLSYNPTTLNGTTPTFTASLSPKSGTEGSLVSIPSSDFTINSVDGTVSCSKNIPSGTYVLELYMKLNDENIGGVREIVKIVNEKTTVANFEFLDGSVKLNSITTSSSLGLCYSPIIASVTYSDATSSSIVQSGGKKVSITFSNIPSGKSSSDISGKLYIYNKTDKVFKEYSDQRTTAAVFESSGKDLYPGSFSYEYYINGMEGTRGSVSFQI